VTTNPQNPVHTPIWNYVRLGLQVDLPSDGTVQAVRTSSPAEKTSAGIGAGSTLAQVQSAYPGIPCSLGPQWFVCTLSSSYQGTSVQTVFPSASDKPTVAEIAIQYGPFASGPPSRGFVDPCIAEFPTASSRFPKGSSTTSHGRTLYSRAASLMLVCSGFGAPQGLHMTAGMKCEMLAQLIGSKWAHTGLFVSGACSGSALAANPDKTTALTTACSFLSALLGVANRAAGAIAGLACASAPALGGHFEANHETAVAIDVWRRQKCIQLKTRRVLGLSWSAVSCP
jgi:hypothetical protein